MRSGSWIWGLALALLAGIVGLSCTTGQQATDNSTGLGQPRSLSVRVDDPGSPVLGTELVGAVDRDASRVQLWNRAQRPGVESGSAAVVPVEVADLQGNDVGFLSTCFPAELCSAEPYVVEGECVRLDNGGEDCLISSSSGQRHIIHVMQGPVTVAEAIAAADLAEGP